jgi:integrase
MAKGKSTTDQNLTLRNGTYYARIQVNRKDRRVSLFTSDRAEAKRRLKAHLEEAALQRSGAITHHTYQDAVKSWHKVGYSVRGEKTRRRYKVSLRQLHPYFHTLKLHEITRRKIGEYVTKRIDGGATHATVRRDLTALSGLLRHTVAMGWRDDNPAREWDRSTIREDRDPIERPCMRSFEACVAESPPVWAALLRFLLASGFRLDVDAGSLRRDQVNWQTGTVTFITKRGRRRTRQLSAEALMCLKQAPTMLDSEFVFAPKGAKRINNMSRAFEDIRARAVKRAAKEGWVFKPFRLHDLRHEFAIRYLKSGGPNGTVGSIYKLQGMLGHTSVKTTETYLDFLTDEEAEIAKGQRDAADVARIGGEHA